MCLGKAVMANAGTALMGIGRASGDNRAVEAAQQAVESPLLEVSIDGARGILFNVIGGDDMSMHEINTVAESITDSADKDANIIFGATINPELEGEIIVTVVATGFEESYFAKQSAQSALLSEHNIENESPKADSLATPQLDTNDVPEDIDMDLDTADDKHEFHAENKVENIWDNDEEKTTKDESDDSSSDKTTSEYDDSELEKPSFLRRLRDKAKQKDNDDGDPKNLEN
jgi:cell division protein FtsZ